ncbi:TPA: hypothetical protein ACTYSP_004264 [Citrobacter freundii]
MKIKYYYVVFVTFFVSSVNATQCLGYFTNPQDVGITNQWGDRGDQFSSVNMEGRISWPSGTGMAMYKSLRPIVPGNYSTYSIALPKKIIVKNTGISLDVSVAGKVPFNIPMNYDYNAWLIGTIYEGCQGFNNDGWNLIANTGITGNNINVNLTGKGLPSGHYNIEVPYTLAWGTDPNQCEADRVRGTWAEIDPINSTGALIVSFIIENKCDVSGEQDIVFNYGSLSPDEIKGNKKEEHKFISCLADSTIELSLSPAQINLNNGVVANIFIKDSLGREIITLNSFKNKLSQFNIESILDVNGPVVAGKFYGSSILTLKYQ